MYVKGKDNADWMWKEMCFYIPKKFQNNPPKPIDKDVTIKKKDQGEGCICEKILRLRNGRLSVD